jgi:predicted transport protein
MSKFGLHSDKPNIPFENHLEVLEKERKTLLLHLRNFVKNLGNNVIEEVRPHRITYAKSLTFRTFLDIQPTKDSLTISLRQNRTDPVISHKVTTLQDIENVKPKIIEAYQKIR